MKFKIFAKSHFFKFFRSPYLTPRLDFYPIYFQPNELRLCIHLRISGLKSGIQTKIKTNLQIFQKIQNKKQPSFCKIAMPFSAAYSLGEYYLQNARPQLLKDNVGRRGKPSTWLPCQKLTEERIPGAQKVFRDQAKLTEIFLFESHQPSGRQVV